MRLLMIPVLAAGLIGCHVLGRSTRTTLMHGLGVMPDFPEEAIIDAELAQIVAYLQALRAATPNTSSD